MKNGGVLLDVITVINTVFQLSNAVFKLCPKSLIYGLFKIFVLYRVKVATAVT